MESGQVRRRNLPHIDVEGKPSFITACLHGSLSEVGMKKIRDYREELDQRRKPDDLSEFEWNAQKQKVLFSFVDRLLDGDSPVKHLADRRLAKVVAKAFLHFAEIRYHLLAFVVMPSHHHWMFMPRAEWVEQLELSQRDHKHKTTPRESITHSIQSFTASQCNRLLGLEGQFWQVESFDHYARDEDELCRIINYIEDNPVKAELTQSPEDYPWSSAFVRARLGLKFGEAIPGGVDEAVLWETLD